MTPSPMTGLGAVVHPTVGSCGAQLVVLKKKWLWPSPGTGGSLGTAVLLWVAFLALNLGVEGGGGM